MKRFVVVIIAAVLVLACQKAAPTPAATTVSPQRIVSLKPNITEILFSLGAGPRVVGVTTWCNYPDAAKALPKVGDYLRAFPEQVIAVMPNLIIGSQENSAKEPTLQLERMGFKTELLAFTTLEDTYRSIREIGKLTGTEKAADRLANDLQNQITQIHLSAGKNHRAPRVLAVVGHRPLIVIGPQTFLGQMLTQVGAQNIIRAGSLPYPQLNTENLLALDPDVIIDLTMGTEQHDEADPFWQRYPSLRAVQQGRVLAMSMDEFRAGPRLGLGLQKLYEAITAP